MTLKWTWLGLLALSVACGSSSNGAKPPADGGSDHALPEAGADGTPPSDAGSDATPPPDGGSTDPLAPAYEPKVNESRSAYPADVWVTDSMVKVQSNATPPASAVDWVTLHAAKNEFQSFQVHVHASSAARQISVTMSDLKDARSGTTISSAKDVLVSREAYLDVTQVSDKNGTTGMIPDALIPTVDPVLHQKRNAFPVAVPAGQTRSAWVDVLVPQNAPSGWYSGKVTVTDGGQTLATLPVVLGVWDFSLPSTSSLPTIFGMGWNSICQQAYGGYNGCGAYPGANGSADRGVELSHVATATLLLDYRVSVNVIYAGPNGSDWSHFDSVYTPLFNGTAATRLPGAKITMIQFAGDINSASAVQNWVSHFQAKGWLSRLFDYTCDEPPNGCTWSQAQSRTSTVQSDSPKLSTLITTDLANATANSLLGGIDIMTPVVDQMDPQGGTNQRSSYDSWLAQPGKRLFWYQSCDEHESCSNGTAGGSNSTWPSYMVDATPVRNRVFQWLAYLDRIQGELYYSIDYCFTSPCGGGNDPWTSLYAFGGNGDGTLVYPGTVAKIGGTTPVAVPSIRLAMIRDGMQDYEYLKAVDAIDPATAQAAAHSFITNAYTFDNDPSKLEAAREQLGEFLHRQKHPAP